MLLNFSDRSAWNSAQNPLTLALEAKRRQKIPVLDLTLSNPTLCGFNYLKDPRFQILDHAQNSVYKPDPRGLLSAREAVVRYYADKKIQVSPEQIFLTSGTSEAYTFLFRLLGNTGDTILAPKPGYPLFDTLCGLNDLELQKYRLYYGSVWNLDEKSLAGLCGKNSKALIWVNPNNPTGNFASAKEVKTLNDFSVQNSCPLIIDEVFFDYQRNMRNDNKQSFAGNSQALTFTLSGISKILGLPQMKLSWIVVSGPQGLAEEACRRLEVIADAYLSVNTPVQNALPMWLADREAVISEILSRVQQNYASFEEAARVHSGAEVLNSDGGWYAVLRVKGISDEEFCLKLLNEKNVLAHPGYLFDFEEEDCLVTTLLLPPNDFSKVVSLLLID